MILVKDYSELEAQQAIFCKEGAVLVKIASKSGLIMTEEEKEKAMRDEMDSLFEKSADKKEVTFDVSKVKEKLVQLEVLAGKEAKYIVTRPTAVSILGTYGEDQIGLVATEACLFEVK